MLKTMKENFDEGSRNISKNLEHSKRKFMEENEAQWRLKRKAFCLENNDQNMRYFHNYANHMKKISTI
jgi:hypothetical protein